MPITDPNRAAAIDRAQGRVLTPEGKSVYIGVYGPSSSGSNSSSGSSSYGMAQLYQGNRTFEQMQNVVKEGQSKIQAGVSGNPAGVEAALQSGDQSKVEAAIQQGIQNKAAAQKTALMQKSAIGDLLQSGLIEERRRQSGMDKTGKPQYEYYYGLTQRGRNLGPEKFYSLEENAIWGKSFDFVIGKDGELNMYPQGTRKTLNKTGLPAPLVIERGDKSYILSDVSGEDTISAMEFNPYSFSLGPEEKIAIKDVIDLKGYETTKESKFSYNLEGGALSIKATGLKQVAPSGLEKPGSDLIIPDYKLDFMKMGIGGNYELEMPKGGATNPNVIQALDVIYKTPSDIKMPENRYIKFFETNYAKEASDYVSTPIVSPLVGFGVSVFETPIKSVVAAGYWFGTPFYNFGKKSVEATEARYGLNEVYRADEAIKFTPKYGFSGSPDYKLNYKNIELGKQKEIPFMIFTPDNSGYQAGLDYERMTKMRELQVSASAFGTFPITVAMVGGAVAESKLMASTQAGIAGTEKPTESLFYQVRNVYRAGVTTALVTGGLQTTFEFGMPAAGQFLEDYSYLKEYSSPEKQYERKLEKSSWKATFKGIQRPVDVFQEKITPWEEDPYSLWKRSYEKGASAVESPEAVGRVEASMAFGFAAGAGYKAYQYAKPGIEAGIEAKKIQYKNAWENIQNVPYDIADNTIGKGIETLQGGSKSIRMIEIFSNSNPAYVDKLPGINDMWGEAQIGKMIGKVTNTGKFVPIAKSIVSPTIVSPTIPTVSFSSIAVRKRDEPLFSQEIKQMTRNGVMQKPQEKIEEEPYETLVYPGKIDIGLRQRVQIGTMQITGQRQAGKEKSLFDIGLGTKTMQGVKTRIKVSELEREKTIERDRTWTLLDIGLNVKTNQMTGQKFRIGTLQRTQTRIKNPPIVLVPPIPRFGSNEDNRFFKIPKIKTPKPTAKYAPSALGEFLGIRTSKTKGQFTGFEIRGIPGFSRRRKK